MRNTYDAFMQQDDDGGRHGRRHGFGQGRGRRHDGSHRGDGPRGGRGSERPFDDEGFGGHGANRDEHFGFEGRGGHPGFPGGGRGRRHGFDPRDDERAGDGRRGPRGFGGRERGAFDGPFGADFGPGFEPGFGGRGHGPRGGRGPGRGRRGDVRAAILALLGEEPMNGYGLIGAIAEKSEGLWKPGAGSVYPALGLLEDEGLIAPDVEGRKKMYSLTDDGRAYVAEHADEVNAPWERVARPHTAILDLRPELHQLGMALHQVTAAGDQAQVDAARAILEKARKDVYRLLAGDMPAAPGDTGDQDAHQG